jgi:hypothetical protein
MFYQVAGAEYSHGVVCYDYERQEERYMIVYPPCNKHCQRVKSRSAVETEKRQLFIDIRPMNFSIIEIYKSITKIKEIF